MEQNNIHQADAVIIRDELVRLVDIPLVIPMLGMQAFARGTQVRLELLSWDEIDLSVQARFIDGSAAMPTAEKVTGEEKSSSD